MSDEKQDTNEATPNAGASELSDESLKNVAGGEAVTLSFTKIEYTYAPQKGQGEDK